jgi:23S rRNA (adenine2503-C2)-methyltransferase
VLEALRAESGLPPDGVRTLRNAMYKRGLPPADALALLPEPMRSDLADRVALHGLREVQRDDSASDGATKLILHTRAGLALESVVLRLRSGRSSVCVSSQIGCAAHCRFCATGYMGTARSLAAEDILEQVALAGQILSTEGRRLRNVVFMGMGEPMHNRAAVEEAVARLIDPRWFALSPRHVTVSTVGVVDELRRFVARFPEVNLALSLHAARQETRERLMPLAARTSLRELRLALREIQEVRRRPVMIQYLLLAGINDTDADLEALIDYCRELHVHLNLIPFNAIAQAGELRPSPPARQRAFSAALKAAGFTVTTRVSLGPDIAAACGQLARPRAMDQERSGSGRIADVHPAPDRS